MKNNKVIAEFMGDEFTLLPDTDGKCYTVKGSWDIIHEDDFIVDKAIFAYNTSWDILMPVAQKCLEVYHIELMNDDLNFKFYDSIGDIELTYKAVVEFINEYNKTI